MSEYRAAVIHAGDELPDWTPDIGTDFLIFLKTGGGGEGLYRWDGTVWARLIALRGYLWDLTMSNGTDAVNDISIGPGEASDEAGDIVLTLVSQITKQIDAAWALGNNAGGLNTGSVANNTWYEVHLIYRASDGAIDVMFTTTANRETLPSNFTHHRRIGWVRRGTATNLAFSQYGDYFTLLDSINELSTTFSTTGGTLTMTAPPNSIVRFRASATGTTSVNAAVASIFQETTENAGTPNDLTGINSLGTGDALYTNGGHFELRVDSNSQIKRDEEATNANAQLRVWTFGWVDRRRRLDFV